MATLYRDKQMSCVAELYTLYSTWRRLEGEYPRALAEKFVDHANLINYFGTYAHLMLSGVLPGSACTCRWFCHANFIT